ncbi:methyltransferase domain-containing protein [Caballeronia sp. LZ029]|uniref:class I SAM-dependent methyltransferase n=1 Tax=Caballeronia sp. LZ029 TaxID=3038564 RepID=UPI00285D5CE4|nr:methyltransferase domain-containing protein [Caballeronia sp. LZ029]MDR5748453.1 methyltransferase domain-containing protein [Caballeronia sp. LZ029]
MAMRDSKIEMLDASAIYQGVRWSGSDHAEGITERFRKFYAGMREDGANDYDLDRIASASFYLRSLIQRKGLAGKELTAVEIGSGAGAKAISLCGLFGTYIGIEINVKQVTQAELRNRRYGSDSIRFIAGNATDVLDNRKAYGIPDHIDVLILYAVLEHLTLDERSSIMRVVNRVVSTGGSVLVMESPNRLIPYDSHTSGLQFYNWLPDAMANSIGRQRSVNAKIRTMLRDWEAPDATTMLARAGRGVSFHDFDGQLRRPLRNYSFVADGFDVEMLNMEPFGYQEFSLLGYMQANVPDVPPFPFSRSWLDFVIGERSEKVERRFFSPFWPKWASFDEPPSFWYPVGVSLAQWACEPGCYVKDLTFLFTGQKGRAEISVNGQPYAEVDIESLAIAKPDTWHHAHSICLSIEAQVSSVQVKNVSGEYILFQGAFASVTP